MWKSDRRAGVQRAVPGSPPGFRCTPQATTPQEWGWRGHPRAPSSGPHCTSPQLLVLSFLLPAFLAFRAKNNKRTLGGLPLGQCSWPFKMQGESPHLQASTVLGFFFVFSQEPAPFVDKAFQTFAESTSCKSLIPVTESLEHTGW